MVKALEGIKVLDFSQLLAGPYAAMLLGDMGADIIKIERCHTGDLYRGMTFLNRYLNGVAPTFLAWNRNKRSLAINLKSDAAKKSIYKMVAKSDIVIHNFRPGVMEKLGYGYEDLKAINPGIIYGTNSGFGTEGPYVDRPGQDLLAQGLSGIMTLTGKDGAPPTTIGTGLADHLSAYQLVYGILSALYYRTQTGLGQKVEVNLLKSMLAFENQEITSLLNLKEKVKRPKSGIGLPFMAAPYGVYKCSNGYITIAMNDFSVLVEALGDDSLLKYNDEKILYDKRDEVFWAIENITKENTKEYWLKVMLEKDLWVSEVNNIEEIENDPQVQATNIIQTYRHKTAGEIKTVGPGVKLSITNPEISIAPPDVGEHSVEILKEFGIDQNEIDKMLQDGVITE